MRIRWLPTVSGYLLAEFGRSLLLCLAGFIAIYLCVDFFERFASFLSHGASVGLILLYFLLKIPRILTEIMPVAVLAATLLGLGALARRNELMAMRACGISLAQIAAPVLGACLAISVLMLAWNEWVVPATALRAHQVERVKIRKKQVRSHFNEFEIWYHGLRAFTNIDRFDAKQDRVHGLRRYEFDDDFHLRRIVTAPLAKWTGERWVATDAVEVLFGPTGDLETKPLPPDDLGLVETPEDLGAAYREPEELSYRELRREIADLEKKGIDTTDSRVGLMLKLSVPFVSLVMAMIALPLAVRRSRQAGVAANVGTALVVGFSFWVVLAFATSLGKSGVLPPAVAAWSPNLIFAAIGAIFFLGSD
ncbi:LPS export ABC transporter permease LptG [bacterium]|nr:LPS export ABC transporter permease LptG [bacterium]